MRLLEVQIPKTRDPLTDSLADGQTRSSEAKEARKHGSKIGNPFASESYNAAFIVGCKGIVGSRGPEVEVCQEQKLTNGERVAQPQQRKLAGRRLLVSRFGAPPSGSSGISGGIG